MKQRRGVSATFIIGVALGFPGTVLACSVADSPEDLTITVQVYNWAKVSRATLEKGQTVASEIFSEAGIQLKWIGCPCQAGPEVPTLSLRIIPKLFGSTMSKFRSDHLGFAAVTEEGGVLATVFFDRIESLGKGGDLSGLLGLATAHELGHLLLGSNAHTPAGIMQPRWTRQHLRAAERNDFRFTLEQVEAIRSKVVEQQSQALALPGCALLPDRALLTAVVVLKSDVSLREPDLTRCDVSQDRQYSPDGRRQQNGGPPARLRWAACES